MTIELLAAAAARTRWATAPVEVRDRILDLVADSIAVTALGSSRSELAEQVAVHERWSGHGSATVIGSSRGWPAGTAALLNGSAVAADQLQDGHRLARGHPASHVVPVVLALAEQGDAHGQDLLSAVLTGYEVGARLGRAMGGTPDGVHDIGTWGAVAVAASVARLLAPEDPTAMRRSLELAASAVLLTDAHTVFSGATGGHVFLGCSAQLGMSIGLAAVSGLAAAEGSLERHFRSRTARAWDAGRLTDGVGSEGWSGYEVLGGYVKVHPTCAHLHGVNDAVQDLVADGLRAEEIELVDVRVSANAAAFGAVAPDELAARFSVPTSVAVALVHGRLDEATLGAAAVGAPAVGDLADRVHVVHDPDLDAGYPNGRPARVAVLLRDGTTRTANCTRPRGDADRWLNRDQLADKAIRLFNRRFQAQGPALLAAIRTLADDRPVRTVGGALRRAAGPDSR